MENTPKYALPASSSEQGYLIGSYLSPIMDDGFHRQF